MPLDNEGQRIGKERLTRIFQYLKALNEHRNPVKRQIREQPWVLWLNELPKHETINYPGYVEKNNSKEETTADEFILKVRRPKITAAPRPPALLTDWLEDGWDDPEGEIKIVEAHEEVDENGEPYIVRFEDDPKRKTALNLWQQKWEKWAQNEIPARKSMRIFERFYELYGLLQKESERFELVVGDGILNWRRPNVSIHHPLLLQRVQLEFDPEIPEFIITESDHDPELYSALFQSITVVDGREIASCRAELMENNYHPLGDEATAGFFQRLVVRLSSRGEFLGDGAPVKDSDEPKIGRSPVLFLRSRTLGFATAIEAILQDLTVHDNINEALQRIVGVEQGSVSEQNNDNRAIVDAEEDILLGKSANREQIDIVRRLEKHNAVLVQGPPGTGKTHTIANLIGHLLAQGKSVLVTSHTTKALRVLRHQVVEELQPLCVSVLDNDSVSRKQLENSVETIVEWLSKSNVQQLEREAKELKELRKKIIDELKKKRQELLNACHDEYRDVVVAGEGYQPSDAARKVAEGYGKNDWIPSPVVLGEPLPLSPNEVIELYRTNISVKPEDEQELGGKLPNPGDLVAPEEFRRFVREFEELSRLELPYREDLWDGEPSNENPDELESLIKRLQKAVEHLNAEEWKLTIIAAGFNGGSHRQPWDQLLAMIEEVRHNAAHTQEALYQYQPQITDQVSLDEQAVIVEEIITHLKGGGKLGFLALLTHKKWRQFINNSTVGNNTPSLIEHFEALRDVIRLQQARRNLATRWDLQVASLGTPTSKEFKQPPEDVMAQFSPFIKNCLDWYEKIWKPLVKELKSIRFQWETFLNEQPPNLNANGELLRIKEAVQGPLQKILEHRAKYIRFKQVKFKLEKLRDILQVTGSSGDCAQITNRLLNAVVRRDTEQYAQAFQRLVDLYSRRADLKKRYELIDRIDKVAPAWAVAVRERRAPHDTGEVPGDVEAAWLWRQLHDELEKRALNSLVDLQQTIEKLNTQLKRVTRELIKSKAWAAQLKRITLSEQQALVGYLNIVKKIGAGTGKRVPKLRAEARRKTSECRKAVPVWIMPLARVAENFDPKYARFDTVIIDEASQCDVMGLIAMYMARQVVIVGDHEQVSPVAVGQKLEIIDHLIEEHLQGIPNNILYDGQRSVYDLAKESFGGTICLLEHFRCVPEIIQFSNKLSYNGRIKPLRDSSQVNLKPHVIAYRVKDAISENKVNQEEALAVASLIAAAIERPEYKGKTFGVISLLGDEQAILIEKLLRQYLPEDEYDRRRIICGNAAHFQGDERDVMFLSIVDAPVENPPLKMKGPGYQDMYKKRFNVAASRACDQMWVIHSLDPKTDLQPGDLRRQLIEHAENPQAIIKEFDSAEKDTESVFELEVMRRLISAGYKVIPQWKVGYYRIDLVVEGNDRRLAVECDGDRYHPIEKLEEDMARQAILERLGWTFVRIRGSQFFRNPDLAMKPVFERLNELGITPVFDAEAEQQEDNNELGQELKEQVIRRAAELRRKWLGTENEDIEDKNMEVKIDIDNDFMTGAANNVVQHNFVTQPRRETTVTLFQDDYMDVKKPLLLNESNRNTYEAINKENDIQWVSSIEASIWYEMSHWAKVNDYLQPWERGLLYSLGQVAENGGKPTIKQAKHGRRIYYKAIELGFMHDMGNSIQPKAPANRKNKVSSTGEYGNKLLDRVGNPILKVLESLDYYILSLGYDVKKKETKSYYAYKRGKNFVCVVPSFKKLTVYLSINPKSVKLEKGFSRDVSNVGHPGTGDLELTIKSLKDLEKAKSLIYLSYQGW